MVCTQKSTYSLQCNAQCLQKIHDNIKYLCLDKNIILKWTDNW